MIIMSSPAGVEVASGLTAVDVVLREREVAALPGVVRAVRRFCDAPVFAKLRRALAANARTTELEELIRLHVADVRLDALERRQTDTTPEAPAAPLEREQALLVQRVLVIGAKHDSEVIVRWCLGAAPGMVVNGALRAAIIGGQLAAVRLLHPKVTKFTIAFAEDHLLDLAASRGHVDVLRWLHENRRSPTAQCSLLASANAAKAGHIDSLQWIHATYPEQLSLSTLDNAAVHDHHHIVEWFIQEQIPVNVTRTMLACAMHNKTDTLLWLHGEYPAGRLPLWPLKAMVFTSQRELVARVVRAFPERYEEFGLLAGIMSEDLEFVQATVDARRPKKRDVKKAICLAARLGCLDIVSWLSHASNGFVPVRALWQALLGSHLDVIRWVLKQKPELRTRERLERMRSKCLKLLQTSSSLGALELVTHWIEEQLRLVG